MSAKASTEVIFNLRPRKHASEADNNSMLSCQVCTGSGDAWFYAACEDGDTEVSWHGITLTSGPLPPPSYAADCWM